MRKFLFTSIMFCFLLGRSTEENKSQSSNLQETGFGFMENRGQITDQNLKTNWEVKYFLALPNLNVSLKAGGFSYDTYIAKNSVSKNHERKFENADKSVYSFHRIDVDFLNCNKTCIVKAENIANDKINFYTNSELNHSLIEVSHYQKIIYNNIYDNIDVEFVVNKDSEKPIEYNFILHPGAKIGDIKMRYEGANAFDLKNGNLQFTIHDNQHLSESIPASYWENSNLPVIVNYKILEKTKEYTTVGFSGNIGILKQSLVIDPNPNLDWGTYYGGTSNTYGRSIDIDALGNIVVCGNTSSSSAISTVGAFQTVLGGGTSDAYLVKFNSSGVRQWATYYGGALDDGGEALSIDASNNIFLVGTSSSTLGIASAGAYQTVNTSQYTTSHNYDAFLVKFNSNGVRQWGTYYGGPMNDYGYGVSIDGSGNVYMCGTASSSVNISSASSHQPIYGGGKDGFLVKFNTSGVRQWASYYGDSGDEDAWSVDIDAANNPVIIGTTNSSTAIATVGAHQVTKAGSLLTFDGYIAKFNSAGVRQWGTYYGGTSTNDDLSDIVIDASNNIFVGGSTKSTSGIASVGSYMSSPNLSGLYDGFFVKFNSNGVRQWGTYYGGFNDDYVYGLAIDGADISVIGSSASGGVMSTFGAYQTSFQGGASDGILAKFTTSGSRIWGSYYGGSNDDVIKAVVANGTGAIFVTGNTNSGNGISTTGALQTTLGGNPGSFVSRFSTCNLPSQPSSISGPNAVCVASSASYSIPVVSGATSYSWTLPSGLTGSSSTNTISTIAGPLSSGNISVVAMNACGASMAQTYSVTISALPPVAISASTVDVCAGGSVTLTASGASTYTWDSGATTSSIVVSPSVSSTYYVNGTNIYGCTNFNNTYINVYNLPSISIISNTSSICSGGTAILTGSISSGSASFVWSTGATTSSIAVNPTVTTIYTITGTQSSTGCSNTAVKTISVNATPTITAADGVICPGNSFTISPSGASTYSYSSGTPVVSPISTTNYTVNGISSASCAALPIIVTVSVSPTLSVNITGNNFVCIGKSVILTANGASTYSWSNGATTNTINVSPTIATTYSVIGNSGICSSNNSITVVVNPLPTVVITTSNSIICFGQPAILNSAGANTYTWSTGVSSTSISVSPAVTTAYTVTGTQSSTGCSNTAVKTISVNATPTITAADGVICPGNSFTIAPSGASTYSFSSGTAVVSPISTTNYTVNGISSNSCASLPIIVTVSVSPTLPVNITGNNFVCIGNSVILTANGASTYSWSNGATTNTINVSPTIATTYSVVGNSGLCSSNNSITVLVNPLPIVVAVSNNTMLCSGQTSTLTASGATTYTWNTGNNTASIAVSPLATTLYTVIGTNSNGCVNTAVITQSVSTCTGIKNFSTIDWAITVYPNPFKNIIFIDVKTDLEISIENAIGQTILSKKLLEGLNHFDLQDLSSGIYFMKTHKDNMIKVYKIIKD